MHRINPYSPNTHLMAFFSSRPISASNVLNIIMEDDQERAKAVCAVLNSSLFWAHFFLLKEESTGRYINIRFYDMHQMPIFPTRRMGCATRGSLRSVRNTGVSLAAAAVRPGV